MVRPWYLLASSPNRSQNRSCPFLSVVVVVVDDDVSKDQFLTTTVL